MHWYKKKTEGNFLMAIMDYKNSFQVSIFFLLNIGINIKTCLNVLYVNVSLTKHYNIRIIAFNTINYTIIYYKYI